MTMTACVVVAADPAVAGVAEAARVAVGPQGQVVAVVAGPEALATAVARCDVDRVQWLAAADDVPVEAYAGPVADAVTALRPDLVAATGRPADRVLLAAAAARLGCAVLTGVSSARFDAGADSGRVLVDRSIYGGIAEVTERLTGPAALILAAGGPGAAEPAAVEPIAAAGGAAAGPAPIRVIRTSARDAASVDLSAAPRVLAVGRGVQRREDLPLVDALAAALRAAVACSRPLAEGLGWYPRDRYIGVSGQHVAPQLYVAAGISGEVQHMSGCRDAATVVAVNRDPEALIFAESDYAVVGDLYDVLPALTAELGGAPAGG